MSQRYITLDQDKCTVRDTLYCIDYHLATEAEAASIKEDLNNLGATYLSIACEQEAQHG